MSEHTPLDRAHARMQADPDDEPARLRFYECLAASELFLMLKADPSDADDTVEPEIFDVAGATYVLVFDREERLAAASGTSTPYVALSGRAIAGMLAGQGIGLGVNPDVAPSSILLPPEAVAWLNETLRTGPDQVEERIAAVSPPTGLPEQLIQSLDSKLAAAMGLATSAYLVGATFENGRRGHLLGFVDAIPDAQPALARAASEALIFSGIEAGSMDVAFFRSSQPVVSQLERAGLRFDLPQLQETVTKARPAPGTNPEKPPILK